MVFHHPPWQATLGIKLRCVLLLPKTVFATNPRVRRGKEIFSSIKNRYIAVPQFFFPIFYFTSSLLECQYAHGPQDLRPMVGGGSFGPSHPGMMGISAIIKTITLHIEFVLEFSLFYRT